MDVVRFTATTIPMRKIRSMVSKRIKVVVFITWKVANAAPRAEKMKREMRDRMILRFMRNPSLDP
jgi:hypothetical protein